MSVQQANILLLNTTYPAFFKVQDIVWIFVLRKPCFQETSQFIPLETVDRDCLLREIALVRWGGPGSL